MKIGKRYKEVSNLVDKSKTYEAKEALELLIKTAKAKFDESVELHIRLGVDGRSADQQVRGTVVLPAGTGKTKRVCVIAKGDKAEEAKKLGADVVGAEEIITKIQGGWLDFDVCITTPDMMGFVGRVAKILGPKGLMPNPKTGTVTTDTKKAVEEVKKGRIEYRTDSFGNVHTIIGKVSFDEAKLLENLNAFVSLIIKTKPAVVKGAYIKGITISSTMGPGIKININDFDK